MQEKETIVFVHGLWESPFMFYIMGMRIKKAGYEVKYYKYPSVRKDFQENTAQLYQYLKSLNRRSIHLVGHSLGGLIVLELLEKYSESSIKASIILGSPVKGSITTQELGKKTWGKLILGKSNDVLCHGVQIICEHNLAVIAGTGGKGLGQFFADLPTPHDGAISVLETQLDSAVDSIQLPVSHFSMLFRKSVASAIITFLQTGRFDH